MDRVNHQEEYFDEVRTIICEAPKLPARLGEVMSQVMGIQWHRGTEWALEQARAFRDEVKQRAETGQWVCPNERYRLMYVGQGLWQRLEFFTQFEESHGAVFARSNYLSIASDGYLRYGLRDPLRALASRYVTMSIQMHMPGLGAAWALWESPSAPDRRRPPDRRLVGPPGDHQGAGGERHPGPGPGRGCRGRQHLGRGPDAADGDRVHRGAGRAGGRSGSHTYRGEHR